MSNNKRREVFQNQSKDNKVARPKKKRQSSCCVESRMDKINKVIDRGLSHSDFAVKEDFPELLQPFRPLKNCKIFIHRFPNKWFLYLYKSTLIFSFVDNIDVGFKILRLSIKYSVRFCLVRFYHCLIVTCVFWLVLFSFLGVWSMILCGCTFNLHQRLYENFLYTCSMLTVGGAFMKVTCYSVFQYCPHWFINIKIQSLIRAIT